MKRRAIVPSGQGKLLRDWPDKRTDRERLNDTLVSVTALLPRRRWSRHQMFMPTLSDCD